MLRPLFSQFLSNKKAAWCFKTGGCSNADLTARAMAYYSFDVMERYFVCTVVFLAITVPFILADGNLIIII